MPLSALAVLPFGFERFAIAKILTLSVAVAVGCFAVRNGRLPRSIVVTVGVGALILAVAASVSDTPMASWFGRWPRYEGVFVLGLYAACLWLGARLLHTSTDNQRATINAVSAMAVILGTASLAEVFGVDLLGELNADRTGSLAGNATDQGLLGAIAVAAVLPHVRGLRPTLPAAGVVAGVACVAMSGSRAALLALAAALVLQLVIRRGRVWRAVLPVAVGVSALALAVPGTRDRLLASHTIQGRGLLWQESLRLSADRPWLGVGPSGFVDAIGRYHDDRWVEQVGTANPPDSPHLWLLQALAAGGIPLGLVAFTLSVLIGWQVLRAVRHPTPWTAGLASAMVAAALVYSTAPTSPGTVPLVALLMGALMAVPAQPASRAVDIWLPCAVGLAATGAAAVMIAGAAAEWQLDEGLRDAAAGRSAAADRSFETAHRLRPWDADIAVMAAAALAEPASFGDPEAVVAAGEWAQRALANAPHSTHAGVALAVVTTRHRQYEESVFILDRVIARDPTAPQPRIQRALARLALGDAAGGMADLRTAHRLDPDNPVPENLLRRIRPAPPHPPS